MIKKLLLALVVVALIAGLANIPYVKQKLDSSPLGTVFTIGFADTAYAMTPDVTIGHGNDSEVVQAVLDALPAWGGKIELWAGTSSDHYQFANTVSRAIPNVCFEGDGYATYIEGNGTMPLFDDGGQANWTFKSLRTDAGGITRTGSGSMILGCWIDTTYIDDVYLMKSTAFGGDVSGNYSDIALEQIRASNVIYVPLSGDIQTYVNSASAGDTLVLASGVYSITTNITVNKELNIIGQGSAGFATIPITPSHGTLISSTTPSIKGITVASDNIRIASLSIDLGNSSTGIYIEKNHIGIVLNSIDIINNGSGVQNGVCVYNSDVIMRDVTFYTTSSTSVAAGVYIYNDNTSTINTAVDCWNVTGTVQGAATTAYAFACYNGNTSYTITLNLSNSVCKSLAGTPQDFAVISNSLTTNNATINAYFCTFDGSDYDAYILGSNQLNLGGSVLVNNKVYGPVAYRATMASGNMVLGGTLIAGTGSITDSTGAISFDNENLTTTGNMTADYFIGNGSLLTGISAGVTSVSGTSPITASPTTGDVVVGIDTSTFVMQSDTLAGDVTGNVTNTLVADDSHNHTGATLSSIDISDDTNLSGSSPITLTDDAVGINTSTFVMKADSLSGDVTGNTSATVVGDDSHAHTSSTISGLDISADTNLAVSAPVVLTDDTLSVSDATTTTKGIASFWAGFFTVASGLVSLAGNVTQSLATDSGTATASSNTITIAGGEGIDTSGSGTTVTIVGEDASTTNKGVASFTSTDFAASSGAISLSRQRNIILTAAGGTPSTTAGCAYPAQVEIASGIDVLVADFDATGNESIQWAIIWPDEYGADGTYTMTAVFEWTVASGSGDVVWGIQGGSWSDNEAPTLGTSVWVTDTAGTAARPFFTAATAAVTLSGTPAAGEHAQFKVWRGADSGSDTLAVDARLISVKVVFHAK